MCTSSKFHWKYGPQGLRRYTKSLRIHRLLISDLMTANEQYCIWCTDEQTCKKVTTNYNYLIPMSKVIPKLVLYVFIKNCTLTSRLLCVWDAQVSAKIVPNVHSSMSALVYRSMKWCENNAFTVGTCLKSKRSKLNTIHPSEYVYLLIGTHCNIQVLYVH